MQRCVSAGHRNSDWQRSVRAARVTEPTLQSWGCLGASWPAAHFVVFNSAWQVSPLRFCCRAFTNDVNVHSCCKVFYTLAVYDVKNCLAFFELATKLVQWSTGLALEETLNGCFLFSLCVTRDFVSLFYHLTCFTAWGVLCYFWYGRSFSIFLYPFFLYYLISILLTYHSTFQNDFCSSWPWSWSLIAAFGQRGSPAPCGLFCGCCL